jgi:hypothetical protein
MAMCPVPRKVQPKAPLPQIPKKLTAGEKTNAGWTGVI